MGFVGPVPGPVINGLLLTQISELKLVTLTHVSQPRNFLDPVFLRGQLWDLFCFCYILLGFLKDASSEVQMPTDICVFSWGQSSQRTSSETEVYFNAFKRSWFVISDWRILRIRFVCFSVSKFVACDRNYD